MRALACLFLCSGFVTAADPWKLDASFTAAKPADLQDAATTPPPAGAIVLFDGKSLDAWTKKDGKTAITWKLIDGAMEGFKGHGDIISKQKFDGRFQLHLEFRIPYEPTGSGQGRGNSGVYLQGRYEVQILDSYGLKSGKNDCAAIYDIHPPKVNACKAPTVWQSYDIVFTAPRYENGKKTEPARMTVYHNGTLVHENAPIPVDNTRAGMGGDPAKPGPILLQDHGHPVQYRNIWVLPQK
ncbi:MAG: DUF1080 domain-containing protein [Bacteroidales bacterium]|nr:DUF1080 domain-containing protein [Bacteroidales bacterium]